MARATRSSKPAEPAPAAAPKATPTRGGKKRKRASVAEPHGQPVAKQRRSTSARDEELEVDHEPSSPEPDGNALDHDAEDEDSKLAVAPDDASDKQDEPESSSVGDLPLDATDAQKLLDVLEMYVL
jgi:hypothetical protein